MRRSAVILLAFALGVSSAIGLGCGEEDAELLPGGTAREITANLDTVEQLADEGDCAGAESATLQVSEQIESLKGIDPRLERALEQGATRLREVVARCEEDLEVTEPVPVEPEIDEDDEKEREKEEEKALKEEEAREKKEEKQEDEEERDSEVEDEKSLPPQAEGEGKGVEGDVPPPAEEGGSSAGGVSPANPAGEG